MITGVLGLASVASAGTGAGTSVQRDEPGEVMPDRDWDFVHLDLRVKVLIDERRIEGEAAWEVSPLGAPSDLRQRETA